MPWSPPESLHGRNAVPIPFTTNKNLNIMTKALVVRVQRHKKIGDKSSPMVYTLVRKPKDAKTYDLERIAADIEALGGMSAEDVLHVARGLIRSIRQILTDGNTVKVDGLGLFRTTFSCETAEEAKNCTVKNITRVNIRFMADSSLRLVNDTNASTKGAPNNIEFELVTADSSGTGSGGGGTVTPGGGTGEDGGEDPLG